MCIRDSKSDPRAEISGEIVWYDALAPRPEVLLSCCFFAHAQVPSNHIRGNEMNCVGSSKYMTVFTSFTRASFLSMRADQSSILYCPNLAIILEGTITVHYYALLNLNLREPWGIAHFPQPAVWNSLPFAVRNVDQCVESFKKKLKTIYSPEFLSSNSCDSFVHICTYICVILEFYFHTYIYSYIIFIAVLLLLLFYCY